MNEMMNFIFFSIKKSEKEIASMSRIISKQTKLNGYLVTAVVIGCAYASHVQSKLDKDSKRIKDLEEIVGDLNYEMEILKTKGE